MLIQNLVGQTFNSWTVLARLSFDAQHRSAVWLSQCVCGQKQRLSSTQLKRGTSKQCNTCGHKHLRPYEALFHRVQYSAAKRGLECALRYEEFVEFTKQPICHYCTAAVVWTEYCKKGGTAAYNLDRKDSFSGYRSDNLVVCCIDCNRNKSGAGKGVRGFTYAEWYGMTAYFRKAKGAAA